MTVNHNKETLTLWKEPKLYSGSRYTVDQSHFQSGITDYDDWLTQNSKVPNETPLELSVYRQTITEPMKITENLPIMDEYTYGKLTNGDNPSKSYYIFIDRVTTDQYGTSTIEYSIDWWATEWFNITCTKAHLTRKHTRPGYMTQPVSDLNMVASAQKITNIFSIWATYIPSTEKGTSFISYIILDGTLDNLAKVQKGYWYQIFGIPGSDIKDCFIVPYLSYSFATGSTFYCVNTTESDASTLRQKIYDSVNLHYSTYEYPLVIGNYLYDTSSGKYYECIDNGGGMVDFSEVSYPGNGTSPDRYYTSSDRFGFTNDFKMYQLNKDSPSTYYYNTVLSESFTSTDLVRQGIIDFNGNLVWECPIGKSVSAFNIRYKFGISHIQLEFTPDLEVPNIAYNFTYLNGLGFSYECLHPGLFVDSYQEYIMKNREYDIEMRKIQADKELYKSVFSIAENIGFGAAFGNVQGAVAAGVGGVIETIGTFVVNNTFDPKIQEQYDFRYARITDQVSLVGDSVNSVIDVLRNNSDTKLGILSKYTLSANSDSTTRYNKDKAVNGYICDESTDNLQTLFYRGRVLQADNITVEGTVQLDCRYQVVNRLMNGVEFI